MTNLANWQDDIDDALGGDFDGSLSGLCIMSLSFDFSRNGSGPHLTSTNATLSGTNNHRTSTGLFGSSSAPVKLTASSRSSSVDRDGHNDSSNGCFKRFKPSISNHDNNQEENQNKIARQLQQIKNCLSSTSINVTNTVAAHSANIPQVSQCHNELVHNEHSPQPSEASASSSTSRAPSPTNESSGDTSTVGARSPSPSQSCLSNLSHSQASSRSHSPNGLLEHVGNNNTPAPANNNNEPKNNTAQTNLIGNKPNSNQLMNEARNDHHQVSLYSLKDNPYGGSTLKEASFTTSVFTTTAPMHFKSIHHPFPIKQFPLSPYHQISNSSFNPDLYDRYISLDGHQPLQTPLIGIERTQDLLSLKLPPHGPEDLDSHRFAKDWPFEETKHEGVQSRVVSSDADKNRPSATETNVRAPDSKRKEINDDSSIGAQKGFPFNYKGSSNSSKENNVSDQHEPMDLNVSYEQEGCCDAQGGKNMFLESMKHFNPDRVQQNSCFNIHNSKSSPHDAASNHKNGGEEDNGNSIAHQHLGQESMFGIDPSKQKFYYVLAAPISVATKLNEDTMTYLNQAQAYEIKLENTTDVAEAKKGFMCSIINIGFQERHMQQAENELWQQWSQQHPNEKIFSVDMKLSYNVFGVESDGLNKYEFLWDSSKAAGVFIRINSISTEFTPKKHGGEKGVPFKLSIETFSYNSKTHDSYFISASCCQIKVFKPKGAERKIRSDREKISKRPVSEQEKYHRSCDHTSFKECSLTSLHPMADGSLCYYRHSHGHFASKQVITTNGTSGTTNSAPTQQSPTAIQSDDELDHSPGNATSDQNRANQQLNNDSETSSNGQINALRREYPNQNSKHLASKNHQPECPAGRIPSNNNQYVRNNIVSSNHTDRTHYGDAQNQNSTPESNLSHHHLHNHHTNDSLHPHQSTPFNQIYSTNQLNRSVAGLTSLSTTQHFGMPYYAHTLPTPITPHIPSSTPNYGAPTNNSSMIPSHNFPIPGQQQASTKGSTSIYRPMSLDKHNSSGPSNHSTSFKASNLGLTSHNNSFQNYFGSHSDLCHEGPTHDLKDSSINNVNYQHENYDHPQPTSQPSLSQPSRHRSASTTTTNCVAFNNGNQNSVNNRHLDNYMCGTNENLAVQANPWFHGASNHLSHMTSPQAICPQKAHSMVNQNLDTHEYSAGQNFECNDQNFALDSSPQKSHGSDQSSSCHSRFKNNSSIVSCNSFDACKTSGIHSTLQITISSNCSEVVSWFAANRFGLYTKTFGNFSGSDLLRLSKNDLIEICGFIDGIRLYNSLHNQPIKPRRILYVCHQTSEIFHPIYLYDVSLKELLGELSKVFDSYLPNTETMLIDEKHTKSIGEKLALNSGSSTDSRSSMGALSIEAGNDEIYGQSDNYFNDMDVLRQGKCRSSEFKTSADSNYSRQLASIKRLLIDGLTSVKIVATEQVVQILENESLWKLNLARGKSGLVEACMSACHSKRISK